MERGLNALAGDISLSEHAATEQRTGRIILAGIVTPLGAQISILNIHHIHLITVFKETVPRSREEA
ncbi:MAG: hypothetical protein WA777_09245 [Rhodanobacter sp.]